ncbi:MAG: SUMF1/EgtB/PvdO family nonheme iron enzyme [Chloroflexota bacterium]
MARIENTVFISYRRTDVYTALAVYENLKNQGYDVFFDYRSISSGDFEQIITSNIRARAHFLLILTATALDRCSEPGDWLRREIEFAIDEKRNIIPLFFKGFRFGAPSVAEKLTGKLRNLSRYNGLNVHEDYFDEAMHRLPTQFLNIPLDTVLHPVSTEVQKVVVQEQVAADKALEQIEDVQKLVKHSGNMPVQKEDSSKSVIVQTTKSKIRGKASWQVVSVLAGGLLIISLLIWGGSKALLNVPDGSPTLTNTVQMPATLTSQPIAEVAAPLTFTDTPVPTETSIPAIPTLGIGSALISDKDNMTLLYVPAGEFIMGDDNGALDERPAHQVYLDAFWIDETEVTNKMYAQCVSANACVDPQTKNSATVFLYYGNIPFNNFPVIYVDWNMAQTYCSWAGRRLPTEAEWEKAARGTDGRIYPWGNEAPNGTLLNYKGNAQDTTSVKSYEDGKSPYGAYDMLGNVWEWVNDWYSASYYQNSPGSDPPGPESGEAHVDRGGSWLKEDNSFTVSKRDNGGPTFTSLNLGFRCAMSVIP